MIHKMALRGREYGCSDHIKEHGRWISITGFVRCLSDPVQGTGIVYERLGGFGVK
jgi:hypothetical protein